MDAWRWFGWTLSTGGGAVLALSASAHGQPGRLVFHADFENGRPAQFSGEGVVESVQGYEGIGSSERTFGGRFLRNASLARGARTVLELANLPPHDALELDFLLAIIDSWDGQPPPVTPDTPDYFRVWVDGVEIFWESFSNSPTFQQSYQPPPGVELVRAVPLGFNPREPHHRDSAYDLGLDPVFDRIPHRSASVRIEWFAGGLGWSGGTDESWAIDEVSVRLHGGNLAPIADAGGDRNAPLVSPEGALVALDGSGSLDPEGEPLTFEWFAPPGVVLDDPASATPTGLFPVGTSAVQLVVRDPHGLEDVDEVRVTVFDAQPPNVAVVPEVLRLWPPNHQLIAVPVVIEVSDDGSRLGEVVLLALEVTSSEPDDAPGGGDGRTTGDTVFVDGYTQPVDVTALAALDPLTGHYRVTLPLRAERSALGRGRVYTITATAMDVFGNVSTSSRLVVVPRSASPPCSSPPRRDPASRGAPRDEG